MFFVFDSQLPIVFLYLQRMDRELGICMRDFYVFHFALPSQFELEHFLTLCQHFPLLDFYSSRSMDAPSTSAASLATGAAPLAEFHAMFPEKRKPKSKGKGGATARASSARAAPEQARGSAVAAA